MSIINSQPRIGAAGQSTGQYKIERSLRFNSADSAYLNRTPASAGNRKTWTWSGWVKISKEASSGDRYIFAGNSATTDTGFFGFGFASPSSTLFVTGWATNWRITTQLFRDFSAWYHIVVVLDTTQATANDRIKVYVNGVQVTAFSTINNPTQNADLGVNTAAVHYLSSYNASASLFDGYLTEVNFIDGSALTPSSFGENDTDTGVWKPKAYSGSYGTNGFYLKFADNSGTTSTTLGKDSSGNGNNWTPNNFSVTAGAGNDSLVDSPTQYGTDTGAGGEVRGNYCTWNPLDNGGLTLTNGNLDASRATASWVTSRGTIGISSGKWYWESTCTASSSASNSMVVGILNGAGSLSQAAGQNSGGYAYNAYDGNKYNNNFGVSYGATYTNGDVIGVAFDADAGTLVFYKNGVSQGTAYSSLSGEFFPAISMIGTMSGNTNFGQRPFAYTAPSGYKALCTTNLPTPTIGATATTRADDYFNTVLYTGTGSSLSVTGVGFQPDFVWIKERAGAADHGLYDAVRGVQKQLESNNLDAETTETTGLTAFGTDGFTVGALAQLNTNTDTYVAWNWNAGGSNATNTSGTITSTVRANTTAGFSIVSYTGSSASTVGHGLGVAPAMIIAKQRNNVEHWVVYHQSTGKDAVLLFTTGAVISSANYWGSGGVTSTVFGTGGAGAGNAQNSIIAYCFAPVAGYSAFGSYTGNGSSDGPFIYTGFRPKFVMIKCSSASSTDWAIYDATRSTYNVVGNVLVPNLSDAEFTGITGPDIVSNGFKLRDTNSSRNSNGATYIYASFASNPFKYSLGA